MTGDEQLPPIGPHGEDPHGEDPPVVLPRRHRVPRRPIDAVGRPYMQPSVRPNVQPNVLEALDAAEPTGPGAWDAPVVPAVPVTPVAPFAPVAPEPPEPPKRIGLARVILNDVGPLEGGMGEVHDEPDDPRRRPRREPRPKSGAAAGDGRLWFVGGLVAVGLVVVLGGIVLAMAFGPGTSSVPTPSPSFDASIEPSTVPSDSVAPSDSIAPSVEPTAIPSATVAATAPATVVPASSGRPGPGQFTYVVKAGETLSILALRFGVSVDSIAAANGIVDRNLIITGHHLIIPALGS